MRMFFFFFFFETSFVNKILITSIQIQSESLFWDCLGVDFTFHCHSLVNKVFLNCLTSLHSGETPMGVFSSSS